MRRAAADATGATTPVSSGFATGVMHAVEQDSGGPTSPRSLHHALCMFQREPADTIPLTDMAVDPSAAAAVHSKSIGARGRPKPKLRAHFDNSCESLYYDASSELERWHGAYTVRRGVANAWRRLKQPKAVVAALILTLVTLMTMLIVVPLIYNTLRGDEHGGDGDAVRGNWVGGGGGGGSATGGGGATATTHSGGDGAAVDAPAPYTPRPMEAFGGAFARLADEPADPSIVPYAVTGTMPRVRSFHRLHPPPSDVTPTECELAHFYCGAGGVATGEPVAMSRVCDGVADCGGGEDETGCGSRSATADSGGDGTDTVDWRRCKTSLECPLEAGGYMCARGDQLCDGLRYCPGGEDESFCDRPCLSDEYECVSNGTAYGRGGGADGGASSVRVCLPAAFVCDGEPHCPEGDDEQHCTECAGAAHLCAIYAGAGRATPVCIARWELCDGRPHCADASDELHCC